MNLNANSWHAKLNHFVYDMNVENQKNFCPYFWGTILAFPLLPLVALAKGVAKVAGEMPTIEVSYKTSERIGMGLIIGLICAAGGGAIYVILTGHWLIVATIALLVGTMVGIAFGLVKLTEWRDSRRPIDSWTHERKTREPILLWKHSSHGKINTVHG